MSIRRPHHHPLYRRAPLSTALLCAGLLGAASTYAATITVNSNLDTTGNVAICTLRDAMEAANTNAAVGGCVSGAAGADTINFSIPGAGVHTIVLGSALPIIGETVTINGFTQLGSSANTINANGITVGPINALPMIEVDGNGMSGVAGLFYVNTPAIDTTITGLAVGNHPGIAAFLLDGTSHITGNFIGVRADGVTAFPNTQAVYVAPAGVNSQIGQDNFGLAANRNLIARGLRISGASGVTVRGNLIGMDKTATTLMGGVAGSAGIIINGSAGSNTIQVNAISVGSEGAAIRLTGASNTGVQSNVLGIGAGGMALGNLAGVVIDNNAGTAMNNSLSDNTIAFSQNDGILVWDQSGAGSIGGNFFSDNVIFSNTGLGINLRPNGEAGSTVTLNDANDADTGPNGQQNFPVITTAKVNAGGGIDIAFTLNSTPGRQIMVMPSSSPACHASGHGEGLYGAMAAFTGTTDGAGNMSGTVNVATPLPAGWGVGQVVSLLAHDLVTHDTSEFSSCATVAAYVGGPNQPPVASPDTYTTPANTALNVAASGVLINDSDPDGNPITAVLNTNPGHGSLTLNPNGSFVYTPTAGYNGPDGFSYFANDGTVNSTSATTVGITVGAAVNQAPVAANDTYATPINTTLTVPQASGVLFNDTDPDGNPITANVVTIPSHGTLSAFNANGNFTYTPLPGYNGADSFTYSVTDGALTSAAATVTINVGTGAPTGSVATVPTLSEWALALLVCLMGGAGWWQARPRTTARRQAL